MRAYSVASLPSDNELELHVAQLPNGQMSGWLRDAVGQAVHVRGPFGECFYQEGELDRPLLLAGTGTGLSPLVGVLRAAAEQGHRGEIALFHGSPQTSGIYLRSELSALAELLPGLRLFGSVLSGSEHELGAQGRWHVEQAPLDQLVLSRYPKLNGHRLFLCGQPTLVQSLRKRAYLAEGFVQLTSYTDYAFRTLIALACVAPEKLTANEISESYDISHNHLLKVVQKLAELGYVKTMRGKSGGIRLLADPEELTLGAVVRSMEPELGVVSCLRQGEPSCRIMPACTLKSILNNATNQFLASLDAHTLSDLTKEKPRLARLLKLSAR